MKAIILSALILMVSTPAFADDYEDLIKEGYGALAVTSVQGEFNGCDFNRKIPLENGMTFVCSSYAYHYAYDPEVLILKNVQTGDIAVSIDGDLYDGTVYKSAGP
jgi:hypothetical protein